MNKVVRVNVEISLSINSHQRPSNIFASISKGTEYRHKSRARIAQVLVLSAALSRISTSKFLY